MALLLAIFLCIGIAIAFSRSDRPRVVVLIATVTACVIVVGALDLTHEIFIVGAPEGLSSGEYRVWCVHFLIAGGKIGLVAGVIAGTLAIVLVQRRRSEDEPEQNRTRP